MGALLLLARCNATCERAAAAEFRLLLRYLVEHPGWGSFLLISGGSILTALAYWYFSRESW